MHKVRPLKSFLVCTLSVLELTVNVHKTVARSMASTASFLSCDYLDRHAPPQAFMNEQAELVHVNEQISSIDDHISQLTTLRHALLRRKRQLRHRLSLIHTLPNEILSSIFQQLVDPDCYNYPDINKYWKCLCQAFVLGAVSSQFRHVALGTPELWKIPLNLAEEEIGKVTSLLQHCVAIAPDINLFVFGTRDEEEARSVIDILIAPDTREKVRALALDEISSATAMLWIDNLKWFRKLNTLNLGLEFDDPLTVDFGTLPALTRLRITSGIDQSFIVPPSVEYLEVSDILQQVLISLLYQCPNLVECDASTDDDDDDEDEDELDIDTLFTKPLILAHLKRLDVPIINAIKMSSSVKHLQLPSLEYLRLFFSPRETHGFMSTIPLCHKVSSTLTTLSITGNSEEFEYDHLRQLWKKPFPRLRELEFQSSKQSSFSSIIRALALLDSEYNSSGSRYLPALRSITLHCNANIDSRSVLHMLKEWRIGEAFYFDIQFKTHHHFHHPWSPELRDELRLVIGSRWIEITWGEDKVHELGVQDGLLRKAIEE